MSPRRILNIALSLMLYVCVNEIARGDSVAITGTRYENLPAAVSSGRCYPAAATLYVNNEIGTATGTSNFGNFLPDMSACLNVPFPAPITDGIFTWTFDDGDALDGIWSGLDTRVNLPGGGHLLTINEMYVVTGGTGTFLNATGQINETGSAISTGLSAIANYTFQGRVSGPDLIVTPEPNSLILLGSGLLILILVTHVRRSLPRHQTFDTARFPRAEVQ